jgi:hypothetical protein
MKFRVPLAQRAVVPSVVLLLGLAGGPGPAAAQDPAEEAALQGRTLRVYLDCATRNCDRDRFRRDITFVTWVREPQDGDLHIIMTSESAGAGSRYILDFEGSGLLQGFSDRHSYSASSTDVEEETRAGITQTLRLGLVRFMTLAGLGDAVRVEAGEDVASAASQEAGQVGDPWNYWVFSARIAAELEREDREESDEFTVSASANRTTEAWKIDLGFFGRRNRDKYQLTDSTSFTSEQEDWSADAVVVRSLDEHWSTGASVDLGTSTRLNQDFQIEVMPGVEWNYFPWQDASRRRFVVLYTAGIQHVDYEKTTIFLKDTQTVWRHRFDVSYRAQETWGNARMGIEANQILDDLEKYSFQLNAQVDYRLIRGLSLSLRGNYEIIRDQIYLSGEGLTPEEILTEQRQQETGSRLSFDVGISYRFGSIFNSIVNSRFPSVNGGGGGGGGG